MDLPLNLNFNTKIDLDYPLFVSFAAIFYEFSKSFDTTKIRLQLNLCDEIVMTADLDRSFKFIVFLDCILTFSLKRYKTQGENQLLLFRECVCKACADGWIKRIENELNFNMPTSIVLVDIFYPWSNSKLLKQYLLLNAPTNSRSKYVEILKVYFSQTIMIENELGVIMDVVTSNIFRSHFRSTDTDLAVANTCTIVEGERLNTIAREFLAYARENIIDHT